MGTDFRCEKRTFYGSIRIIENRLFAIRLHNHDANFEQMKVIKLKDDIKARALNTSERPIDIVNMYVKEENMILTPHIPKLSNIVDGITRIRRRDCIVVEDCKNTLSEEFKKTKNIMDFYLMIMRTVKENVS